MTALIALLAVAAVLLVFAREIRIAPEGRA